MEKLNGKNILILLLTLLFTACQSYKKVPAQLHKSVAI